MLLTENKKTALLILLAFVFSVLVRLIWVQQFSDVEQFKFNNEFMINTNDGYFWAEGARDILAGKTESTNDLSPFEQATPKLTAFIAKILPFSFETIILYMPVFFSSLIVIPIILIAREFDRLEVGFIAALIGSIAWSYYNRTMVGYYDTDFLNIVFPTVLLWSLIWALKTKDEKYLLIAGLDSIAYRLWYPASYSLEFAFVSLIVVYVIYQYVKKEDYKSNLLLVSFILLAMNNLDSWLRVGIVIVFYILLKVQKKLMYKYVYYIFGLAVAVFAFMGGLDPIMVQLKQYVIRDAVIDSGNGLGLQFFSVMQTVREAGQIPFETFANRISGHTLTFIASLIGYIWFAIRYPVMFLALPMLGLGFLAYGIPGLINGGGLRFTVYAVPVMALGAGYIIYRLSLFLSNLLINDKAAFVAKYILMGIFTLGALYPNIQHVIGYQVPTVFNKSEVEVLDRLKNVSSREDYVVTWWDYGYPIRYYSDVKTLIDGGKHSGKDNFPVSYILNNPQKAAANMARLDVEYTEKRFHKKPQEKFASSNIEQMTLDYGFNNANDFLATLNTDIELPKKTRDVFLYLPNRMLNILPTVTLFSNLDLMNGAKKQRPFFFTSRNFRETKDGINLGSGVILYNKRAQVQIRNKLMNINKFVVTMYDEKGKLHTKEQTLDKSSPVNVIFMKNYNTFLVLDNNIFNSSYIQMYVLENYDKELFEPVELHPQVKIYKLKI